MEGNSKISKYNLTTVHWSHTFIFSAELILCKGSVYFKVISFNSLTDIPILSDNITLMDDILYPLHSESFLFFFFFFASSSLPISHSLV